MSEPQPGLKKDNPELEPQPITAELNALVKWGQGMAALGGALSRLAGTELQLALGDVRRLVLLGLLVVPISCFAWLGLSSLVGWWCYSLSESVALGLTGFVALQFLILILMGVLARRYLSSIGLPHTRAQIRAIMRDLDRGTQRKSSEDTTG